MNLTLTQKKILKLLSINCRFTNQDIAKAVGVSADTINYQINNLIKKRKLGEFFTQFDYRTVDFGHYHYLIRLKNIKDLKIDKLNELQFITFINTSQGKYDLQLIVVAQNELDLEKHTRKINEILGKNIQDFSLLKFTYQYKYTNMIPEFHVKVHIPKKKRNIAYLLDKENFAIKNEFITTKLDELDHNLIIELLKNPRASYLEISKKLKISHEAIRYRIANYVKKGVILNFGLSQNYKKYGYFANYLFLKLKNYDESKFKSWIINNPQIFYSARLLGEYNCIIYILSKTPEEFNEQTRKIREFFSDKLLNLELLYFEKTHKNIQFPELILKNT